MSPAFFSLMAEMLAYVGSMLSRGFLEDIDSNLIAVVKDPIEILEHIPDWGFGWWSSRRVWTQ